MVDVVLNCGLLTESCYRQLVKIKPYNYLDPATRFRLFKTFTQFKRPLFYSGEMVTFAPQKQSCFFKACKWVIALRQAGSQL